MIKLSLLLLSFLVAGCQANESLIDPLKYNFKNVSFDVVQKQLVIEPELPLHLQRLVSQWFDQKVMIDGFDGEMKFIISNYYEKISSINDGKRVDLSMSFSVVLNKPNLSKTEIIDGNVSSFSTLTGNFSLAEFDTLIQNTQSDLILRLSQDLKTKNKLLKK